MLFVMNAEGTSPPNDDTVLHPRRMGAQNGENQHWSRIRDVVSFDDSPSTCDRERKRAPNRSSKRGVGDGGPLSRTVVTPVAAVSRHVPNDDAGPQR